MSDSLARKPVATTPDAVALVAVDRATAELRRGDIVVVEEGPVAVLVEAAESVVDENLHRQRRLAEGTLLLALTNQRAQLLGLGRSGSGVLTLALPAETSAGVIRRLADPTADSILPFAATPLAEGDAGGSIARFGAAGIELAKLARLLPAVLVGRLGARPIVDLAGWAAGHDLLRVSVDDILRYQTIAARSLRPVGEARVPLAGAEDTRVVAFRPSDGGIEHLAIIIGTPKPEESVLVRLHSECFTGDLLGSLRCDCGDQLRGAIAEIARQGNGVLLYLAQEGRGIGLVNKLRAYQLQDRGADTVEANQQLGFDADERIYLPAAEMLRWLGFRQVRLMTNNPEKVAGLERCGIGVTERVAHVFPANDHNERYLETKASRFGHIF